MLRRRSTAAVVANLAKWVESGFSQVSFVDNTFNLSASYSIELCRRISETNLKINWRCIFYPSVVSRELVEAMSKAGCREVSLAALSLSLVMGATSRVLGALALTTAVLLPAVPAGALPSEDPAPAAGTSSGLTAKTPSGTLAQILVDPRTDAVQKPGIAASIRRRKSR